MFVKSCSSVALDMSFSGIFCSTVIKSFCVLSKISLLAEMVLSYRYTSANSRTALSHVYHGNLQICYIHLLWSQEREVIRDLVLLLF